MARQNTNTQYQLQAAMHTTGRHPVAVHTRNMWLNGICRVCLLLPMPKVVHAAEQAIGIDLAQKGTASSSYKGSMLPQQHLLKLKHQCQDKLMQIAIGVHISHA